MSLSPKSNGVQINAPHNAHMISSTHKLEILTWTIFQQQQKNKMVLILRLFHISSETKTKKNTLEKFKKVHISGDSRSAIKQFHIFFLVFVSYSCDFDWASRFGAQFIILALIYRIYLYFLFFLLTSREFLFQFD